jgi:predicted DNA-binding transcriptional regulator
MQVDLAGMRIIEPRRHAHMIESEKIRECYRHAEVCKREAAAQTDPVLRKGFLDTAAGWVKLAQSYEFEERLTRFTFKPGRQKLG